MGLSLSLNDYLYNTVLYASPIGIANLYIIEGFYALENIAMKHSQALFPFKGSSPRHPGDYPPSLSPHLASPALGYRSSGGKYTKSRMPEP